MKYKLYEHEIEFDESLEYGIYRKIGEEPVYCILDHEEFFEILNGMSKSKSYSHLRNLAERAHKQTSAVEMFSEEFYGIVYSESLAKTLIGKLSVSTVAHLDAMSISSLGEALA